MCWYRAVRRKSTVDGFMFFATRRAIGRRVALDAMDVFEERGVASAQLNEGTELFARQTCHSLEEGSPGVGRDRWHGARPHADPFYLEAASLPSLDRWARFAAVTLA